uniref:Uncharacterized protein n=1 Tax=Arundo donax TaxID=35708 RepID=A0A0A9BPL2_ARUDO
MKAITSCFFWDEKTDPKCNIIRKIFFCLNDSSKIESRFHIKCRLACIRSSWASSMIQPN